MLEVVEQNHSNTQTPHAPLLFDSMLTMEKFKVPELCVRILIGCVRENQDRIDLLYDCCSAFCHEYATDFTFFNKFIEDEIVQVCFFQDFFRGPAVKTFKLLFTFSLFLWNGVIKPSLVSSTFSDLDTTLIHTKTVSYWPNLFNTL